MTKRKAKKVKKAAKKTTKRKSFSRGRPPKKRAAVTPKATGTRKTIQISELKRKSFSHAKDLPGAVEIDGERMEWVGIGWIPAGEPTGKEVLVVDDED